MWERSTWSTSNYQLRLAWLGLFILLLMAASPIRSVYVLGQAVDPSDEDAAGPVAEPNNPADLGEDDIDGTGVSGVPTKKSGQPEELKLLWLIGQGGLLMIPIGLMSVLVVALVIERFISLRTRKVMPPGLIREIGQMASGEGTFDPREAYRLCQNYPSSTAQVVRSMLLKIGRPQSEVEHSVGEASERESQRMYANVRWLNLAAAVTPLMGLFGTVWGMITAFFNTTHLLPGQNKADFLAKGIYTALVTTLGGLAVAIPAAIFAHYFEGRIHTLFHRIDELLFSLMPQIERYEGRLRVRREGPHTADSMVVTESLPARGERERRPSTPTSTASS